MDFGASRHVARIILSALRYNPEIRAAINVKYSERNLSLCREAGLSISSFDRAEEPENVSTMDWGTAEAIKKYGGVPQVIYDKGSLGKEPMIRLLGTNAVEVAKLAVETCRKVTVKNLEDYSINYYIYICFYEIDFSDSDFTFLF